MRIEKREFFLSKKGVLRIPKGRRIKPEKIVTLLTKIDVLTFNGMTLTQACKDFEIYEKVIFDDARYMVACKLIKPRGSKRSSKRACP